MRTTLRRPDDSWWGRTAAFTTLLLLMITGIEISAQEEQRAAENDDWAERLMEAPEGSNWSVGARFGIELSGLPDSQALEILTICWIDIADDVRPQILKGLGPALKKTDGINDRYFNILHLGYRDMNERVQKFAKSNVNKTTFAVDADDETAYEEWYESIKDKTATEVIVSETAEFVSKLKDLDDDEIQAAIDQLSDAANTMRELTAMRNAAIDGGMMDRIDAWVSDGKVRADDGRITHIRLNIESGENKR